MTIEDANSVDAIGIDDDTGACVLTISDHLPWGDSQHLLMLQEKINEYLAFIESGEIFRQYPEAQDRAIEIQVLMRFEPSDQAETFLARAAVAVYEAGFELKWARLERA